MGTVIYILFFLMVLFEINKPAFASVRGRTHDCTRRAHVRDRWPQHRCTVTIGRNVTAAFSADGCTINRRGVSEDFDGKVVGWAFDAKGWFYVAMSGAWLLVLDELGTEVYRGAMNGAADYDQIERFGDEGVLLLVNMEGYLEKWGDANVEDYVVHQRHFGAKELSAIPKGSRFQVVGRRIYAVYRSQGKPIRRSIWPLRSQPNKGMHRSARSEPHMNGQHSTRAR